MLYSELGSCSFEGDGDWEKDRSGRFDSSLLQVIMPSSIIDWKVTRAMAGTSSFGFSGTNSHGRPAELR